MTSQRHDVGFAQTLVATDKAHKFMTMNSGSFEHCCPDDRVQSGSISTAREHSDFHVTILSGSLTPGEQNPNHLHRFHQVQT